MSVISTWRGLEFCSYKIQEDRKFQALTWNPSFYILCLFSFSLQLATHAAYYPNKQQQCEFMCKFVVDNNLYTMHAIVGSVLVVTFFNSHLPRSVVCCQIYDYLILLNVLVLTILLLLLLLILDVASFHWMKPIGRSLLENPWHNSAFEGSGFVRLFLPTNLDNQDFFSQ